MPGKKLSVREICRDDIALIIDYWLNAEHAFLKSLGVDVSKIPSKKKWEVLLSQQLNTPYEEKKSYCIIWQLNGKPIGHSNINKIIFG